MQSVPPAADGVFNIRFVVYRFAKSLQRWASLHVVDDLSLAPFWHEMIFFYILESNRIILNLIGKTDEGNTRIPSI